MKNTPLIIKQQQLHLITRQLRAKEREKRDLENKICVLKGLRLSIDYSNDDFHSASKSQIFFFLFNSFYDSDNNKTAECEVVCEAILLKDFERE